MKYKTYLNEIHRKLTSCFDEGFYWNRDFSGFLSYFSSCPAQVNFCLWVCRWQYQTRNAHMHLLALRTYSAFKLDALHKMWQRLARLWICNQTPALLCPHIYIYLNGCFCLLWSTGWGLLGFPHPLPCWLVKVPFWLVLGITAPLRNTHFFPKLFYCTPSSVSMRERVDERQEKKESVHQQIWTYCHCSDYHRYTVYFRG